MMSLMFSAGKRLVENHNRAVQNEAVCRAAAIHSEKDLHMLLGYYLLAVNLIGAVAVLLDKHKAVKGAWRIPERTLWLFCIAGACPGVYFAMRAVRHKTLHKRFMLGIPAVFILQIVILCLLKYYL